MVHTQSQLGKSFHVTIGVEIERPVDGDISTVTYRR